MLPATACQIFIGGPTGSVNTGMTVSTGHITLTARTLERCTQLPYTRYWEKGTADPHHPDHMTPWLSMGYPESTLRQWGEFHHVDADSAQGLFEWCAQFRVSAWVQQHTLFVVALPGMAMPPHRDVQQNLRDAHPVDLIRRRQIFVEDWRSGHYFEVNGRVFTGWSAGDWVEFSIDELHMGGNIGNTNRYTVQVSGALNTEQ